jgi:tetratricopeptide (TPR) repeat protein
MGDAAFRACCHRAGEYLLVSPSLRDAVEAVRCFLEAQAFDRATEVAEAILGFMERYGQLADVAAFAAEVLAALPPAYARYAHFCVYEANTLRQLGATRKAFERYQEAMTILKSRVEAEPDRADYQHDLAVSYTSLGDLLQALGQGEVAHQYHQQALEIAQRLVAAEPDRADYQRDLWVSYTKLGDLFQALEIAQWLVTAEPDRADYQWDLVVSLLRMAAVEPDNSTEHRTRALAILRDLHAADRLFPEQEHLMRELEQELRTED